MKKIRIIFTCVLFALLLPGCSLFRKPAKIPEPVPSTASIVTPALEPVDEGITTNINEIIESEDTVNTVRCELGKITYEVPDTWEGETKDSLSAYYPSIGNFKATYGPEESPLVGKSAAATEQYLTIIKKSILEAHEISKNYTEIDSNYITIHDIGAMDFKYRYNYENTEYQNRALILYYDSNLYIMMLVQPDELIDDAAFDRIIESIEFASVDGDDTVTVEAETTKEKTTGDKTASQDKEADSDKSVETVKPATAEEIKDSILEIHKDTEVLGSADSLTLIIRMTGSEPEADVRKYFEIVKDICDNCNLESVYSSISFLFYLDNNLTFTLSYKDYLSSTDYTSLGLVVFNTVYKEIATEVYNEYNKSNER
jgi:hypothetical protein